MLSYDQIGLFDAQNNSYRVPITEITGARYIEQWCDFNGLRWKIMAIYDDDGTREAVENPPGLPFDAGRNAAYEHRHRQRFPIGLTDPTMHVLIGHDDPDPKPFASYQEIAAAIPGGRAFHPREYNGLRLQARVPVTEISNQQTVVKWIYGDQS